MCLPLWETDSRPFLFSGSPSSAQTALLSRANLLLDWSSFVPTQFRWAEMEWSHLSVTQHKVMSTVKSWVMKSPTRTGLPLPVHPCRCACSVFRLWACQEWLFCRTWSITLKKRWSSNSHLFQISLKNLVYSLWVGVVLCLTTILLRLSLAPNMLSWYWLIW